MFKKLDINIGDLILYHDNLLKPKLLVFDKTNGELLWEHNFEIQPMFVQIKFQHMKKITLLSLLLLTAAVGYSQNSFYPKYKFTSVLIRSMAFCVGC